MKMVEANSDATFTISLVDELGNSLSVSSVSYELFDGDNSVIVSDTPVTHTTTLLKSQVTVIIPAIYNFVSPATPFLKSRLLQLNVITTNGNLIKVKEVYVVGTLTPISFMNRSYQTYQDAEVLAYETLNLENWDSKTETNKINALKMAFDQVGMLAFNVRKYNVQSPTSIDPYSDPLFQERWSYKINNINEFSPEYMLSMPEGFIRALKLAQLLQADYILGKGGTAAVLEQQRLISETVGESSKTWKSSKALRLPLCDEAMRALTGYIQFGGKLGRA